MEGEEKKPLEERAKDVLKVWISGEKWDINPFKEFFEVYEITNYLESNGYIDVLFPDNKYMCRYEPSDKGKEWASSD